MTQMQIELVLQVKDPKTGEYIVFNGNMIGLTIAEYLISQKKKKE